MAAGGGGPPHADRISVGTSPTPITTIQPQLQYIRNIGVNTIWLGGSSVTAGAGGTGFPLKVDEIIVIQTFPRSGILYGIVAAGSEPVSILSIS